MYVHLANVKGRGLQSRLPLAAATRPVVEALETRQLLTVYTYTVPSSVYPSVYLEPTPLHIGEVDVHFGSATGTIGFTFDNTTGTDLVDFGSSANVLVDRVPAALKPAADGEGDS